MEVPSVPPNMMTVFVEYEFAIVKSDRFAGKAEVRRALRGAEGTHERDICAKLSK